MTDSDTCTTSTTYTIDSLEGSVVKGEKATECVIKKMNTKSKEFIEYIKSKNNIITNASRTDGYGEQVKAVLYTIAFSDFFGFDFVYTPIKKIEHFDNNPETLNKIEKMSGFIDHYEIDKLGLQRNGHDVKGEGVVGYDDSGRIDNFCHLNMNLFLDNPKIEEARFAFKKNKKYTDYFDPSICNAAIHIRRSNVFDTTRGWHNKLLEYQIQLYIDEYYIKLINMFLHDNDVILHIYSQELDEDKYRKCINECNKIVFHLHEELYKTFPSMVFSDILITGASTLSYSAALLRSKEQKTIYLKYFHPPLEHWDVIDKGSN